MEVFIHIFAIMVLPAVQILKKNPNHITQLFNFTLLFNQCSSIVLWDILIACAYFYLSYIFVTFFFLNCLPLRVKRNTVHRMEYLTKHLI